MLKLDQGQNTCPNCAKTIRRNQKYGCCDNCTSRCHMKCLEDKIIEGKEHLFCVFCRVEDVENTEKVSFLNKDFQSFVGRRGMKIIYRNINGVSEKINTLNVLLSDSKQQILVFFVLQKHTQTIL